MLTNYSFKPEGSNPARQMNTTYQDRPATMMAWPHLGFQGTRAAFSKTQGRLKGWYEARMKDGSTVRYTEIVSSGQKPSMPDCIDTGPLNYDSIDKIDLHKASREASRVESRDSELLDFLEFCDSQNVRAVGCPESHCCIAMDGTPHYGPTFRCAIKAAMEHDKKNGSYRAI